MRKTRWAMAGRSDPGCVRDNNEDSLAIDEALGLMVVADGMGGHNAGEVASRIATETLLDCARKMMGDPQKIYPGAPGEKSSKSAPARQLEHCIRMANTIIFEKAKSSPQNYGMGTTIVAAVVRGGAVSVGHVGDSRLYVFRNGQLQALTEDHSLVVEQVRRGLISAEQAEQSALQNVLIRALGTEAEVQVDIDDHPAIPGDVFLLCTDGLTKMLREDEIAEILRGNPDLSTACNRLVEAAREAGGIDNITVAAAKSSAGKGNIMDFLDRIWKRK